MTRWALFARAIRYQKTATDNAFSVLSAVQHGSEEMLKDSLKYCSWMPESGKKSCLSYTDEYIQATERIRSMVNEGFDQVENSFSGSDTPQAKPTSPPQKQIEQPVSTAQPVKTEAAAPAPQQSQPAAKKKAEPAPNNDPAPVAKKPASTTQKSTKTAAKPRTTRPAAAKSSTASRTTKKTPAKSTAAAKKTSKAKATAKATTKATTAKPTTSAAQSTAAAPTTTTSKAKTTGTAPHKGADTQNPGT
jgi:hypothetical protein